MKKKYTRPTILKVMEVELEYSLLAGSVVDNITGIETGGQEVGGYFDDMGGESSFNHEWAD